jgi:hypothetical protein
VGRTVNLVFSKLAGRCSPGVCLGASTAVGQHDVAAGHARGGDAVRRAAALVLRPAAAAAQDAAEHGGRGLAVPQRPARAAQGGRGDAAHAGVGQQGPPPDAPEHVGLCQVPCPAPRTRAASLCEPR